MQERIVDEWNSSWEAGDRHRHRRLQTRVGASPIPELPPPSDWARAAAAAEARQDPPPPPPAPDARELHRQQLGRESRRENVQFLEQLVHWRSGRQLAAAAAAVDPTTPAPRFVTADAQTEAVAADRAFMAGIHWYDPTTLERERPPRPVKRQQGQETVAIAAVTEAEQADREFFRSLTHWQPG